MCSSDTNGVANVHREDIINIFEVVDLDDSEVCELKEFLVALTVAHALDLIKISESQKMNAISDEVTAQSVKSMCGLIVSAYLLFDPMGNGYITKSGVEEMIANGKKKGNNKETGKSNLMLNENRWKEMVL